MAVEIHEDQLLVPLSPIPIVYTVVGTSGAQNFAAGDTVINEMTLTLAGNPGDVLLVSFDGTIRLQPNQSPYFTLRINGAQIGERVQHISQDAPNLDRRSVSLTRAYQVTVTGAYLIEAILTLGGAATARMPANDRTLTVLHYRG